VFASVIFSRRVFRRDFLAHQELGDKNRVWITPLAGLLAYSCRPLVFGFVQETLCYSR